MTIAVRQLTPKVFSFSCPACGFEHDVTMTADSQGTYAEVDENGSAVTRHCIACTAHLVLPAITVRIEIAYFDQMVPPEENNAPP